MINLLKSIKSYHHECFVEGAIDYSKLSESELRSIERKRRDICLYPQGKPDTMDLVYDFLDNQDGYGVK
jgi:hypothetical protein